MNKGHVQFVAKYIPYVGGGEIQFLKTAEYLRKLGVDVETAPVSQRGFPTIVHFFGSHGVLFNEYAKSLKYRYGIPYVVSTIFFYSPKGLVERFYMNSSRTLIKYGLEKLIPRPGLRNLPFLFKNADLLLPNTRAEAGLIQQLFPFVSNEKIKIIPNGVEKRFGEVNPDLFRKHYNINYDFVLNVGRIEPRKNQLSLIRALKGTNLKLVIIGNQSVYPDYTKLCFEEGQSNVFFINEIPHNNPLLASAYAAARVFALPSSEETPGISALEAGLAKCSIVITERGGTREYFKNFARYVNPYSIEDIKKKILNAWTDSSDKEAQKSYILSNFSWERVAELTISSYETVINKYNVLKR